MSMLTLFGSTSTLLCCALPAAIGALAGTAAIGTVVSAFPWLVPLARHKGWVFAIAGLLIVGNAALTSRHRSEGSCDVNGACDVAGHFARRATWAALVIYLIGGYFAYGRFFLLRLV